MKPKEFDELVRQKFDQNDFEYNPRNWDRLEEELDGRAKKRSLIVWWWMPLAGVAASVALAVGIPAIWQQAGQGNATVNTELVQKNTFAQPQPSNDMPVAAQNATAGTTVHYTKAINRSQKHSSKPDEKNTNDFVAITFHDAPANNNVAPKTVNLLAIGNIDPKANDKKKPVVENEGYRTFKPTEEVAKAPKLSVILSGGINRGSQNNGYMAGATIRRMISDKVYVESDVAFANSNNTQPEGVLVSSGGGATVARHTGMAAKSSNDESGKDIVTAAPTSIVKEEDVTYNLSYAQVTPSIGYQLIKRMSIGAGPDFQQMLVDNRPAPLAADRNNIQEAPSFDVGLMGKSEYALTKKIKAAVYYRKGINSIINLNDKYIDRDYLQFQLKCTIFNK